MRFLNFGALHRRQKTVFEKNKPDTGHERTWSLGAQRELLATKNTTCFRRFGVKEPRRPGTIPAESATCVVESARKSFYDIPPQRCFNKLAGFETSSRPYLLKYRGPLATPTSLFDIPLQTRK